MKRFLLALSLLTVSVSSSFGQCPAPEIAPWTETFTTTVDPPCWTQATTTGGPWVYTGSPDFGTNPTIVDHTSGVANNYTWVDQSATDAGVILTGPEVDVTALTVPALSIWIMSHNNSGSVTTFNEIHVEASDGIGGWVPVDVISGDFGFQWVEFVYDVTTYVYGANLVQFRFRAESGGDGSDFDNDMLLDDVSVLEMPTCPTPSNLTASNITSTGADLNWQENGTATTWNIEYGPTGFTQGTGTMITGTMTNPESITGLSAATQYDFYVQADCGGGDLSAYAGPFTFATSFNTPTGVTCGTGFSTFVFSDDMETNTGWTGDIGTANAQWDFPTAAPGGNSTGTGPSGPASGTTFAEFEASGTTTTAASMVTPLIDLSSGSSEAELSFYMHAFGADIGTLNVGVGTSPAGPFTNVFSWSGQYQTAAADPWEHIGIDLTAYLGQQIYIEFNYAALASGFEGDLAIDLVQVETCVTCPAPTNFNLITADLTSADFDWVEAGAATTWELEYDLTGFTPGAGMDMLTTNNPETVSGLTSNSFYDVYVRSVCGPGDTSAYVGPISFNTFNQGQYMDWNTDCPMGGFYDISGTGTDLGLTDDSEAPIDPLPFPILFQGQLMTNATVGNNGGLQLGTTTANIGYGGNFTTLGDGTMFPWGDDLDSETGNVYWEVIGTSPNQVLIIQWDNTCNFPGSVTEPTVTFQIQIEEATGEIYYVYDDVVFGGTDAIDDYGANADIGISGPNQDYTVSTNDPQYLTDNSCVHFFYTNCPNPTNYTVIYTTFDEAGISWSAGLAGETDWTVIYGPAGFDPLTAGTTITTTAASAILTGLDDITTYDVYIYADCNPGTLQSNGVMGQFTTLPNCADPTGVTATTAPDSLFTSWGWTANPGFNSTGFNLQYGEAGFDLYTGTVVNADNNLTDTTFDATFLGGGVYEVYVQAVCGTDTSNFVGPIVFTMPLSNDSTCLAENLMVDGTVYTFNNSGASVQTGETGIAPPATGCQTTDGWCNTSINFSTWFTFTAPASGNVLISGSDEGFNGQVAVYETTDCSNFNAFTLLGANDDNVNTGAAAPEFILCGLTPGNTYYLMHDSWSTVTTGQYSLRLEEVAVNAGTTNGIIDVCTGAAVDLFNGITGNDAGGVWTEWIPTAGFSGSTFNSAGLAYQTFNFAYTVSEGCAVDSVQQQVQIYGPSSAGNDGVLDVCLNQPYDLVSGLSGNVDLGGTWYDPANNALASSALTAPNIPGQFNYDYITSNGVCPEDTSNVVVNVSSGCDWLNVEELYFSGIEVYPNPATDNIFISNLGADDVFSYELTDAQGKVIATKKDAINGTKITEIDVKNLEIGLYMIRVYNENAATTFRIVKQ